MHQPRLPNFPFEDDYETGSVHLSSNEQQQQLNPGAAVRKQMFWGEGKVFSEI
jgi:hypothetical protein